MRGLHDGAGRVAAGLRALDVDVLALAEPPRGPLGPRRLDALAAAAGMRVVARVRTCAVLVRVGLEATGGRGVRQRWTPGLTRRGVAIADVVGIRVMAVHLGLRAPERALHTDRLVRLVAATPGPCVVAGDLNEAPGGASWRSLRRALRDLAPGSGPTFPATAPRARIDAVLGRGVDVRAGAVLGPAFGGASDHLPVVVTLVLTGRAR